MSMDDMLALEGRVLVIAVAGYRGSGSRLVDSAARFVLVDLLPAIRPRSHLEVFDSLHRLLHVVLLCPLLGVGRVEL